MIVGAVVIGILVLYSVPPILRLHSLEERVSKIEQHTFDQNKFDTPTSKRLPSKEDVKVTVPPSNYDASAMRSKKQENKSINKLSEFDVAKTMQLMWQIYSAHVRL